MSYKTYFMAGRNAGKTKTNVEKILEDLKRDYDWKTIKKELEYEEERETEFVRIPFRRNDTAAFDFNSAELPTWENYYFTPSSIANGGNIYSPPALETIPDEDIEDVQF